MSIDREKIKCCVCQAYLFEEDDVVYCPICGAPHHRECYNSLGKCALEHLHGTDKQYERKKAAAETEIKPDTQKVCPHCNKKIDKDARVCPYCGRPNITGMYINFDMPGGVPKDADIGDSVSAEQARNLVAINTQRYIPKFLKFKQGKTLSWNWLAFLFPEGWFFSRKLYKAGALVITVLIALQMLLFPLTTVINQNVFASYDELTLFLMNYISESMSSGELLPVALALVGSLGTIAVRIVSALFADKIYYNNVLDRAKAQGKSDLDRGDYLRKYGGVNIYAFLLGVIVVNNLPNIIFMFFA